MNLGSPSGRVGRMMRRPGLLLAILIYVALDLSLPMMPGALVFEPAGSVDTIDDIQIHRIRGEAPVLVLPAPTGAPCAQAQPPVDVSDQPVPTNEFALGPRVTMRLPRATLDSAPSSEDSH